MIYLEEDLSKYSEKALEELMEELPTWRRTQAMRFKHNRGRLECALSYTLLCRGLKEMGYDLQPTFDYGKDGKPTLRELPEVHFNLSHCKHAVVCAIAQHPVGVDVEALGRYSERLAKYTMNEQELAEINAAENKDVAFTTLWTMKEATMKLTGEGIGTNVRNILADSSNIIYNTRANNDKGYVITVAKFAQDDCRH